MVKTKQQKVRDFLINNGVIIVMFILVIYTGITSNNFLSTNNLLNILMNMSSRLVMALGIAGGIEKANKVMMPLLFIMFVGLGIYIFTLPGSSAGYKYIFTLNPKGLFDIKLWIYAFG